MTLLPPVNDLIKLLGEKVARAYLRALFLRTDEFMTFVSFFSGDSVNLTPNFHHWISSVIQKNIRSVVVAPRGGAKSTLIGLYYVLWSALCGNKHHILYISDTFDQAKMIVGNIKSEVEKNALLLWLYPELADAKIKEESIELVNHKGETVLIVPLGQGMKIRGRKYQSYRPDLVVMDDIENLDIVYSERRREDLKRWVDFDIEPAMDRYEKKIVLIGTILHSQSLVSKIFNGDGRYKSWGRIKIPAILPDGSSFWPDRFPIDYLKSIRDDPDHPDYVGSVIFAQEYMNSPQDDSKRVISSSWIRQYNLASLVAKEKGDTYADKLKAWLKDKTIIGGIDAAISEKQTADFFSFYTYALDKETGREYQLDLLHFRDSSPESQVEKIAACVKEWGHDILGIESVMYQAGLKSLVESKLNKMGLLYGIKIEAIKTDKDKIRRARIHSSAFEAGLIYLRNDHQNYDIILNEILDFPAATHDDAFDSLMLSREARGHKRKGRVFAESPI